MFPWTEVPKGQAVYDAPCDTLWIPVTTQKDQWVRITFQTNTVDIMVWGKSVIGILVALDEFSFKEV